MFNLIKFVQIYNLGILVTGVLITLIGVFLFKRKKTKKSPNQNMVGQTNVDSSSDMTKAQDIFRRMNR